MIIAFCWPGLVANEKMDNSHPLLSGNKDRMNIPPPMMVLVPVVGTKNHDVDLPSPAYANHFFPPTHGNRSQCNSRRQKTGLRSSTETVEKTPQLISHNKVAEFFCSSECRPSCPYADEINIEMDFFLSGHTFIRHESSSSSSSSLRPPLHNPFPFPHSNTCVNESEWFLLGL